MKMIITIEIPEKLPASKISDYVTNKLCEYIQDTHKGDIPVVNNVITSFES